MIIHQVYELDSPKKNTLTDKIFDKDILEVQKWAISLLILDNINDLELSAKSNESFYYHFDHSIPKISYKICEEIQYFIFLY